MMRFVCHSLEKLSTTTPPPPLDDAWHDISSASLKVIHDTNQVSWNGFCVVVPLPTTPILATHRLAYQVAATTTSIWFPPLIVFVLILWLLSFSFGLVVHILSLDD